MSLTRLKFVLMKGEGIGGDFAKALRILLEGIPTISFEIVEVDDFRLPGKDGLPGELDPKVIQIFKEVGIGMKGPTRTLEGKGPKSINVKLRVALDLFANVRPLKWLKGVNSPVKRPQDLDVVIFRENTQDVYMGVDAEPGSEKMKKMITFLREVWDYPLEMFTDDDLVGGAVKLISKRATDRIMHAAMEYAIKHNRKKVVIMHKGNIMKTTEGAFRDWCLEYALANYRDRVYVKGEEKSFTAEQKKKLIYVDTVIADDTLAQILQDPKRFDVVVTMNLNGDLVSDAGAAQVGGVPLSPGANIGDEYAMFEAIGGTADNIEDMNIANPTAYLLAFAMLLEHRGFDAEAEAIRTAIAELFEIGVGTADMKFENHKLSTTDFAASVAKKVKKALTHELVG